MSDQIDFEQLRPIERRVLAMRSEGVTLDEIANRFRKSPEFVQRMLDWIEIPRTGGSEDRHLRPVERRVLDLRSEGQSHSEIAERFKKGERFIRQVEGLAHFKESQRLLGS